MFSAWQYCVFGRAHTLAVLMRLSIADGRGKNAKISGVSYAETNPCLINSVIGDSVAGVTKAIGVTVANEGREE